MKLEAEVTKKHLVFVGVLVLLGALFFVQAGKSGKLVIKGDFVLTDPSYNRGTMDVSFTYKPILGMIVG